MQETKNSKRICNLERNNQKSHKYIRKRINVLKEDISISKQEIDNIKETIKKPTSRLQIKHGTKNYELKKGLIKPNYESKTVLTDSTWSYVSIYLKASKNEEALMYWDQAQNFYEATLKLDMLSKPLTTYYCFLNASKALLRIKGIGFDLKHGVSGEKQNGHYLLSNEVVRIYPKGILSGLCTYFQDSINIPSGKKYEELNFKNILYNLEYIHRAYHLTYNNQAELLIPVTDCQFVHDKSRKSAWFQVNLETKLSTNDILKKLVGFSIDKKYDNSDSFTLRRNKTFTWEVKNNKPTEKSIASFEKYYKNMRRKMRYIYSPNKLWYIKRDDVMNVIDKHPIVLTFAGMHRLSELSRYDPSVLQKYLDGKESWLLTEFISKSIEQFVDNISSEITGDNFRVTGFRT